MPIADGIDWRAMYLAEKARADAAEAILRRIRDDQSWRTNDNELWRDILAAIGATHD